MKFQMLRRMNSNQVLALEFRDEALFRKLSKSATSTHVKEIAYKNSQQQQDTNEDGLTAKQKMIADLKSKLLAPAPINKK